MSEANRAGKSDRAEIRAGKIEFRCSNFEGVLPFRGEAQNCGTVKFLLYSSTYERGLKLSLIKSPSGVGRPMNEVRKSILITVNRIGTGVFANINQIKSLPLAG